MNDLSSILGEPYISYLEKTSLELQEMLGPMQEVDDYEGPIFRFGESWFGFSLSHMEALPIGFVFYIIDMKLENFNINLPDRDISIDELNQIFGQYSQLQEGTWGNYVGYTSKYTSKFYGSSYCYISVSPNKNNLFSKDSYVDLRLFDEEEILEFEEEMITQTCCRKHLSMF